MAWADRRCGHPNDDVRARTSTYVPRWRSIAVVSMAGVRKGCGERRCHEVTLLQGTGHCETADPWAGPMDA